MPAPPSRLPEEEVLHDGGHDLGLPPSAGSRGEPALLVHHHTFAYTVTPQGVISSSDLFNLLTDGSTRYDGTGCLKNCDDWLLFGSTLDEIEKKNAEKDAQKKIEGL